MWHACWEERGVCGVLVVRPEGKRPLGRPRRTWETGMDGVNWIQLAQDMVTLRAFVNTVMNLRVPLKKVGFFDKLSVNQFF
jgi:hypothetical protein